MSDGIAIYNKSDIDAIVLPNTIPTTYQLEVGTQYVSMVVSNYSPYYWTFAGLDNKVFATVKPWTITPVFLSVVGRVLVNVNVSLGTVPSNSETLLSAETLTVTLSTKPNYNSVVELNPQTGIAYQTVVYDSGIINYGTQTLTAGQVGNYQDYSKLTFNVKGAKRIRIYITFYQMTGLSGANGANVGFQHDYWESSDGTNYYYNSDVYDFTTSNGTGYAITDSGAKPTLESGFTWLQLRPFFYNSSSSTVTVSGGTRIVLEGDY